MQRSDSLARPFLAKLLSATARFDMGTCVATLVISGPLMAQGYGKFAAGICRVRDLDGNGRDELAISDQERRTIWVVDPMSGDVVLRVTDADRGSGELPTEDFLGWSITAVSSSRADLLTVWGGFPRPDGVPEQKLVDLATGDVVGSFRDGLLRAAALPGVPELLSTRVAHVPAPEDGPTAPERQRAEHETTFRLLDPETLSHAVEARLPGWSSVGACSPGDLDGDDRADLLVLSRVPGKTKTEGSLELHAFSGSGGATLYTRSLGIADFCAGRVRIVPTGDIDADGRGDCALRARPPEESLVLFVSGATGEELHRFPVGRRASLSALGDVDGDGVRDVALADKDLSFQGERNTIQVRSSKTGRCLYEVHTPFDFMAGPEPSTAADAFGIEIVDLGDVDGDGTDDFAASANDPMSPDGEFVAVVSGRDGEIVKLLLGKDYRNR